MSRARSGRGKGRQAGAAQKLGDAKGVSDDLERFRRVSEMEGVVHPGGIEVETYPTISGAAVDDDWLTFPKRSIVWRRGDNGQRIAYIHAHGAPTPLAGSDFSILEIAARQYEDGAYARSKLEMMVGDSAAQVRADVHHFTAGSSGTKVILDHTGKAHYLFDKDNGSALLDGHLEGSVGAWQYSMVADTAFRFYGDTVETILDTQSPAGLANDGIIYFRKTGVYLIAVRGHTNTSGGWLVAGFNNSVTHMTSCGGITHLGVDGLGHMASVTEIRRYTAGEHIRFGGYHSGGGTLTIVAQVFRLPF